MIKFATIELNAYCNQSCVWCYNMSKLDDSHQITEKTFTNMSKYLKQKLIADINKIVTLKNSSIDSRKEDLKFEFEDITKELRSIEENLHRLKIRINNRVVEHRKYFFEILKKGIDVRKDGLSWCLVRLIELKSFIEISKFPKFLNNFVVLICISEKDDDDSLTLHSHTAFNVV